MYPGQVEAEFLSEPLLTSYSLHIKEVETLASLHICPYLSEPSLLTDAKCEWPMYFNKCRFLP